MDTSHHQCLPPRALLCSGGLDSAILLAQMLKQPGPVHPLYVRQGLAWESVELSYLQRFLEAIRQPSLQALQVLQVPIQDIYGGHWSLTGQNVPDAATP